MLPLLVLILGFHQAIAAEAAGPFSKDALSIPSLDENAAIYAGTWVNTSQIFPSISNVTFSSRLSFVIVFGTIPVARCKFALLIFQSIKQFLELVIK